MKTITKNTNRLSHDLYHLNSDKESSLLSLLWHVIMYDIFSSKDCLLLESLTPKYCTLFVLKNNNVVFASDSLQENIDSILSELNFSSEASFVQHFNDKKHHALRILTTPLDNNILVGLVSPSGLATSATLEDSFLHQILQTQKKYTTLLQNVPNINTITDLPEPILIINSEDDQIIGFNKSALLYFDITKEKLLNSDLSLLQKQCLNDSKRKMQLTNCIIGRTTCSVVKFPTVSVEQNTEVITTELLSHAEYLLNSYQELQTNKSINSHSIKSRIEDVHKCYQNITHLHSKDKTK